MFIAILQRFLVKANQDLTPKISILNCPNIEYESFVAHLKNHDLLRVAQSSQAAYFSFVYSFLCCKSDRLISPEILFLLLQLALAIQLTQSFVSLFAQLAYSHQIIAA